MHYSSLENWSAINEQFGRDERKLIPGFYFSNIYEIRRLYKRMSTYGQLTDF